MNPTQLKRLHMLYEMLSNYRKYFAPSVRFNIRNWAIHEKSSCGSAACALGSAAAWPPFQRMGLCLTKSALPSYRTVEGYAAAMKFFGIREEESIHLFSPYRYSPFVEITPADVAARLKPIITKYERAAKRKRKSRI